MRPVCVAHAKLRTARLSWLERVVCECSIAKAARSGEREKIRGLVQRFWGESEQLAFGRRFRAASLPAYAAKVKDIVVGFMSFA